jgi:Arc/MetJ-type ribon-helix-helix transcriptional regulator
MEKRKSIEVPESLYNRIEARIKGSNFNSVSEYVSFVLREKLVIEENESKPHYTPEEEEKVKDRLRALGYL